MLTAAISFAAILIIGGIVELLCERSAKSFEEDDRADLAPGIGGWVSAALAFPLALAILLFAAVVFERVAAGVRTASAVDQWVEVMSGFAVGCMFALFALYLLWASYVTVFHRVTRDQRTIVRRTPTGEESRHLAEVKLASAGRFHATLEFADGTKWRLAKLRGIDRFVAALNAGRTDSRG